MSSPCTKRAYDKALNDRDELLRLIREVGVRIEEAAKHGDFRENAEYQYGKEEKEQLTVRLQSLEQRIFNAEVLSKKPSGDTVEVGTIVDYGYEPITILGELDFDLDTNVFNCEAPLCRELLGKRVGETARLPNGRAVTIKSIGVVEL